MAHFIPTSDEADASQTLALFMSRVIAYHGIPDDIVSDRGSVFTSKFTKIVMEGLQVKQNLSTAFHPQTDGQTERTNATLEQYLRCFINYQQDDWSDHLPQAELCYNNSLQSTIGHTPFFANHGYHPRYNVHIPRVAASNPKAQERLQVLKQVQDELQFHIKTAHESQERNYNHGALAQPTLNPGDLVMLKRTNIKTARPSSKLDAKSLGPFKVLEAVNSRSFRLDLPVSMSRLHPVFHVSLLEPYQANTLPGRVVPPPPPIEIEGESEYDVEEILDSRLFYRKRLQYLVRWTGYQEPSWELADNLQHAPDLVAEFHTKYPSKPGPPQSLPEITP